MPKFGGTEFSLEELFILRDKLKDLHPDKQRELLHVIFIVVLMV